MGHPDEVLLCRNLQGGYTPKQEIIHGLNFSVHKGEIVGLIGSNGTGKSTTLKALLDLLPYRKGDIAINGFSMEEQSREAKKHLGYVPELPQIYDELTLIDHLRMIAAMYQMPQEEYLQRMDQLTRLFSLHDKLNDFPADFSKGMQQKTMILCAFLHQPDLYIIDEPFIGLDPFAIKHLTNLLQKEKERGTGILMSTHVLDSAEKICDRFIIMKDGCILAEGTLQELYASQGEFPSLLDLYIHLASQEFNLEKGEKA